MNKKEYIVPEFIVYALCAADSLLGALPDSFHAPPMPPRREVF
jgi:hypothetical protein